MRRRPLATKKLLVASIGVATATFAACGNQSVVGNFMSYANDASPSSSGSSTTFPDVDASEDGADAADARSQDAGVQDATLDASVTDAEDAGSIDAPEGG